MNTFRVRIIGDQAEISGVYQKSPDKIIARNTNSIVLKSAGYTHNPGSRNSGISEWVPSETTVYEIQKEETDNSGDTRMSLIPLISWEHRRGK